VSAAVGSGDDPLGGSAAGATSVLGDGAAGATATATVGRGVRARGSRRPVASAARIASVPTAARP
jgi:hypothetical protein